MRFGTRVDDQIRGGISSGADHGAGSLVVDEASKICLFFLTFHFVGIGVANRRHWRSILLRACSIVSDGLKPLLQARGNKVEKGAKL